MTKQIKKLALQWFVEHDVIAYEMDGKIFVSTGEFDVQISNADIKLRASFQNQNNTH